MKASVPTYYAGSPGLEYRHCAPASDWQTKWHPPRSIFKRQAYRYSNRRPLDW